MKYKLFLSIFLALILINFACASEQSLGTFKQDTCISLLQTCSNCSFVNITSLIQPNSSIIINNVEMTQSGTDYSYTFCNTQLLGNYIYNTLGDPDSVNVIQPVGFTITPSGSTQTTAQGLGSMGFILLVLALTCIFGWLGWKLVNNDIFLPMGVFFIMLAGLLLIYNVWLLYEFKLNYTGSTPNALVPETIFYIFMTILVAGLMAAFFLLFTKWKVIKEKFKAAIKPEQEDNDELI